MVPKSSVRELDMTVDEALKYIISMGVVAPRADRRRVRAPPALPAAAAPRRRPPEIDRAGPPRRRVPRAARAPCPRPNRSSLRPIPHQPHSGEH